MKVLVTGGAGFIGTHLCARLLKDGHSVLCVDNFLTGSEDNITPLAHNPRFELLRRDVCEPFTFEADAVFHLASPASPVGYWNHPFATIRANTEGTLRMLEGARRCGARFLMASTSEAYGDPLVHPQTEEYFGNVNPIGPRACYDESKRLGETLTMEYHRHYDVDARIVRIFNTYGPNSQLHDGRMIPNFITQALCDEPVTIHGDGSQTRSICYVEDLVEGLMLALFSPGTTGEVINLGNPDERSVRSWAEQIMRLCHSRSRLVIEPPRLEDPARRQPDITKARRLLGWEPRVTPEEGLPRTITWFRSALDQAATCPPATVH